MTWVSTSNQSGSESISRPSMSNRTARGPGLSAADGAPWGTAAAEAPETAVMWVSVT